MTVALVINGSTYFYPETGDVNWGPDATDWASAVTVGMLQKAGGNFTLLADVNFGGSFGLISSYYTSRTANAASAGALRLARADVINWRNEANDGNLPLAVNSSNQLTFNGTVIQSAVTVTDTNSIDLTLTGSAISAYLNLSADTADPSTTLIDLTIEADGLKAQVTNTAIIAAIPNASSSVTGLLTNTDWTTFNGKQAAGNYITALTGDVTASGPGSVAATIANSAVSLAKMANLAANSIIGNNTGSPATPLALSVAQTTAMLNAFVGDSGSGGTKGLVPAPAAGDAAAVKFLKADGTWATTPAGPSVVTGSVSGIYPYTPVLLDDVIASQLGLKQYLHGTSYNGGNAPTVSASAAGATIARGVMIPYLMQDGTTWRLKFQINVTYTSASGGGGTFTINSVDLKTGCNQTFTLSTSSGTGLAYSTGAAIALASNDTFYANISGTSTDYIAWGDVELNAKPNWVY